MSFDVIFVSRTPLDYETMVKAARNWAQHNPCFDIVAGDGMTQLCYENPDTLVHVIFDIHENSDDEIEEHPEERELLTGFHRTGSTTNLNFMRPAFFADELIPLAADFAKAIGADIYDPQDMVVLDPDTFAKKGSYRRHLREVNDRFVRNPQNGVPLKQVRGDLLQAFWRQNTNKDALQERLGPTIFVPTMLLLQVASEANPTTGFVWTRALPLAIEPAGVVLLHREGRGWFRTTAEHRIAPFQAFRQAISEIATPLQGRETTLVMDPYQFETLERSFDRLFASLPRLKELKDAVSRHGVVGIVDSVEDQQEP